MVALMLLVAFARATPQNADLPANNRDDHSFWNSKLRSDILSADNYDPLVAPRSYRGHDAGSRAGTDVELNVKFFKVKEVSMSQGRMQVKVWLRMTWRDLRLSWHPDHYGGISYTHFLAQTAVGVPVFEAEIWTPDLQPYNAMEPIVNTMDPAMAKVFADGTVFFSRPGTLDVMCMFSGLVGT